MAQFGDLSIDRYQREQSELGRLAQLPENKTKISHHTTGTLCNFCNLVTKMMRQPVRRDSIGRRHQFGLLSMVLRVAGKSSPPSFSAQVSSNFVAEEVYCPSRT